jgi:hypothetical protein
MPWFIKKHREMYTTTNFHNATANVDFIILVLRICGLALQFLPSSSYPLDKIRGMLLADIRVTCDDVAVQLEPFSSASTGTATLIGVQQHLIIGLRSHAEGSVASFRQHIIEATSMAQDMGIRSDSSEPPKGMRIMEREMARRLFCTLYILDSALSRQLDHLPYIAQGAQPGHWLHFEPPPATRVSGGELGSEEAPDGFWERILEAQLAEFWRKTESGRCSSHDLMAVERHYEKFCQDFLAQVPSAFSLSQPDLRWDKAMPRLAHQRKLFHITVYDSICWNFRPLLLERPENLPTYKQILAGTQRIKLAAAACLSIQAVSELHALLGDRHLRLASIITPAFEAATVLLYLLMCVEFPGNSACLHRQRHVENAEGTQAAYDPLEATASSITRAQCLRAVQSAFRRLQLLAEASRLAGFHVATIRQMMAKLPQADQMGQDGGGMTLLDPMLELADLSDGTTYSSGLSTAPGSAEVIGFDAASWTLQTEDLDTSGMVAYGDEQMSLGNGIWA